MSRILLLLDNRENARLLTEMLGRRHELSTNLEADPAADLAIVDASCLKASAQQLINRKQEEDPVLFPVLLVTNRQNIALFTGPVFKAIDEVVLTPVEKLELFARVEMLLRARRLSLELRLRKDDLEAFIHAMTHDLRAPLRTEPVLRRQWRKISRRGWTQPVSTNWIASRAPCSRCGT